MNLSTERAINAILTTAIIGQLVARIVTAIIYN